MIITDLNHLELVSTTDVIGGSGEFYFSDVKELIADLDQDSYATAYAESQFESATAEAVSYNVGAISQSA